MKRNSSKVFISYSHDSPEHEGIVWRLSDFLIEEGGIDADLDVHEECPREGWPQWMRNKIKTAKYVLMICTKTYKRRF